MWVGDNRREGSKIRIKTENRRKAEIRGVKRTIVSALLLVCVPSVLAGCKAVVCKCLREVIHNGTHTSAHTAMHAHTHTLQAQWKWMCVSSSAVLWAELPGVLESSAVLCL